MIQYLKYLYVKYKPWPKYTRDIRRWSRWSIDKKTKLEIMLNGKKHESQRNNSL